MDHGTGVVIGETAVVGNRVSLMHVSFFCSLFLAPSLPRLEKSLIVRVDFFDQGVTLGGTGKEIDDRHPKVGEGALIGASVTILGNIKIGHGAMVASGSLVLKNVPPHR